ncbi:hypothetical protein AB833_01885 [Chromatiales bacterium (ex Bugula neritina AB1)]|nr:hypothetical protein AB833_01885 [Chromatiales bacterium (ex Bugula neritina AB1)]
MKHRTTIPIIYDFICASDAVAAAQKYITRCLPHLHRPVMARPAGHICRLRIVNHTLIYSETMRESATGAITELIAEFQLSCKVQDMD